MSKKIGRARCGSCDRIVYDPNRGRRRPRPHERLELENMRPSIEAGRLRWEYTHSNSNSTEGNVFREPAQFHAPGTEPPVGSNVVLMRCPGRECGLMYEVDGLDSLLVAAGHRGEDFILSPHYRV